MEKHRKISMEQSPKFNRNWIYFKKSSKILLLHLSDLQYIEYCFNQPKGHFWLEKNAWNSYGTWWKWCELTSAQLSLKLQCGIPFSMVTNRILGNSLSSFNIFRNPSTQKEVGSSSTFFTPVSKKRWVTQYLGFTIRGSKCKLEIPEQTLDFFTAVTCFGCTSRKWENYTIWVEPLISKVAPFFLKHLWLRMVIPNHWSLRQKLCGAQGSKWIEEPYLQRNLYYPPVYRIYTWIWQTHASFFKNSATFFWGVEESHTSMYIKRQTKKKSWKGFGWGLASKTDAIHCCLRLSEET